jgi:hypothetical protein
MSTPGERYRAVVECRTLLAEVVSDAGVPAGQRYQAQDLVKEYPTASEICDWIAAGVPSFPSPMARAIDCASALLHAMRPQDWPNKSLSRRAIGVLRHYPLVPVADRLADHVYAGGHLGEYLASD